MQRFTKIKKCRVCKSKELYTVIDLKDQPLANYYSESKEKAEEYPLKLNRCKKCGHLQLSIAVNPETLFTNYLYVSGTSKTLSEYFDYFVDMCDNVVGVGNVLEIACNDATQLDKFKKHGWNTYGVDPAKNIHRESSKRHNIVCGFWGKQTQEQLPKVKFDAVVAQNVFAHVDDIHGFLDTCKKVMSEDTYLFLQTSQIEMVLKNEFDTVYHEHVSYFHTKPLKICANAHGMSLIDVFKTDIHGGSYVFVLKKGSHDESKALDMIKEETQNGLYSGTKGDTYFACKARDW